ncbi:hypothetical protein E2562_038149 [Oryza meyeriana var. granulata]|uniref:Uncharacterized protein n=1 Tax=Oryza meyeriana var. granulata TaxID=110450 RepID=A0A6G1DBS3_9ORYZ|nr:hypothetical protein E2562_038149 [Oryza meyeriana var. granulata]
MASRPLPACPARRAGGEGPLESDCSGFFHASSFGQGESGSPCCELLGRADRASQRTPCSLGQRQVSRWASLSVVPVSQPAGLVLHSVKRFFVPCPSKKKPSATVCCAAGYLSPTPPSLLWLSKGKKRKRRSYPAWRVCNPHPPVKLVPTW